MVTWKQAGSTWLSAIAVVHCSIAQPVLFEDFTSGSAGWFISSIDANLGPGIQFTASTGYSPVSGNPGGCLTFTEGTTWNWTEAWTAPVAFHGDHTAYYGGSMRFEIIAPNATYASDRWMYLHASGRWFRAAYPPPRSTSQMQASWQRLAVPLVAEAWIELPSQIIPTTTSFANALISVDGIYVVADWTGGNTIGLARMDNFGLHPRCAPDLSGVAVLGGLLYGVPDGTLNNDDFFYYLAQFAAGNLAVADLTTGAIAGQPGYGVPNGVLNNEDFFYYLALFAAGC